MCNLLVYPNMASLLTQLYGKMKQSNNRIMITEVESFAISLEGKNILPSVLDFWDTLKMRISPLYNWNKFPDVYPAARLVTQQHRSLKEGLGHEQNHHIQDDPAQISRNNIVKRPNNPLESEEKLSINVLLIDNDQDILFTFKSMLEAEGYHVESFADPTEALTRFVQVDPSYYKLVLTDIRMPNLNGFQLYQKLREINSDIKVLFMTAFDVPANLQDTMPTIKDSDIIKKPIEEEQFVSRIKKAVNLE
jgi:CheY-like chemotaxis protein